VHPSRPRPRRRLAAALTGCALVAATVQVLPGTGAVAAGPSLTDAAPPTTPARTGPPVSIAVLGDSISQGTGSDDGGATVSVQDGGIGDPRPRNSWATGDWPGLDSYLQRVRALPGGAGTVGLNLSANGANMRNDFLAQAQSVPAGTGLVLVEMGGNDLCRPTEAEMTSVADFRAQLRAGLTWLQQNRPETLVTAHSVPDIYNLWYLRGAAHKDEYFGVWPFGSTAAGPRATRGSNDNSPFWARQFWDGLFGSVIPCKSLLVDPTNPRNAGPTPTATHASEARRLRVRARTAAFNDVLREECATVLRCRYDGGRLFEFSANRVNGALTHNTSQWRFVDRDISTQDHFHPSFNGQKKLAAEAFAAGYDFTDRVAPVVSTVASPAANTHGWHRTDVTVARSATDAAGVRGFEHRVHAPGGAVGAWVRTVGAGAPAVPVTAEGTTHVEVRALDVNGNLSASLVLPVRIDKTLPQAHPVTPAAGATFVQHEQVRAEFSCSDAGGSQVDTCVGTVGSGEHVDTSTVGEKTFTVTATDRAGNAFTTTRSYTVVDVTPPGITIDSPAVDAAFPRHDVVAADYTCTDEVGGSGLARCDGTVPDGAPVPTDEIGDHTFTVQAADRAGNTASLSRSYTVVDVTAPVIEIDSPQDGAVYAHHEQVVTAFACIDEDGGSGVAPGYCEGTVDDGELLDTSALGTHAFTVTATDRAGNRATLTRTYSVVDVTAPTVSSPHEGIEYKLGQPVGAVFTCTDEAGGSGVASCVGPAELDTSSIGAKSFEVVTSDVAGNRRTETVGYVVVYAYGEIRQPINRDGSSVFKAGSTVPVKFQVTDAAGVPVDTATARLSTLRSYDGQSPPEEEQETTSTAAATSGNLFRYDSTGQQYVYNLATKGLLPGAYQVFIRLDDGKEHTALFTLRS